MGVFPLFRTEVKRTLPFGIRATLSRILVPNPSKVRIKNKEMSLEEIEQQAVELKRQLEDSDRYLDLVLELMRQESSIRSRKFGSRNCQSKIHVEATTERPGCNLTKKTKQIVANLDIRTIILSICLYL